MNHHFLKIASFALAVCCAVQLPAAVHHISYHVLIKSSPVPHRHGHVPDGVPVRTVESELLVVGAGRGQILAGADPATAILYQGSIMMAICATVCLTVLSALLWGYRSLWDADMCIHLPGDARQQKQGA